MQNTKKIIYQKKNYSQNQIKALLSDFIFITGGDPAGIGAEIIRKSLQELGKQTHTLKVLYFFNSSQKEKEQLLHLKNWDVYFLQKWNEKEFILFDILKKIDETKQNHKNLLITYEIGKYNKTYPSVESGNLSLLALKEAIRLMKHFGGKSLVTAPVSKEWISKAYKKFTGHTGYLAQSFHSTTLMILYSPIFSVIPLTEHIPLKDVPRQLKKRLQDPNLINIIKQLKQTVLFKKKWVFCGLNPHSGENGLIGKEELEIIIPFIKTLKKNKIFIEGPLPSDSVFTKERFDVYDLYFCCYHDQALIPFKSIVGQEGINLTFGLPILRTSPCHGPAFDIAFKDKASFRSMYNAIKFHMKEHGV